MLYQLIILFFSTQALPKITIWAKLKVTTVKIIIEKIWISQKVYIKRILEKFSIISCKSRLILLSVGISLSTNNLLTNEKEIAVIKKVSY